MLSDDLGLLCNGMPLHMCIFLHYLNSGCKRMRLIIVLGRLISSKQKPQTKIMPLALREERLKEIYTKIHY